MFASERRSATSQIHEATGSETLGVVFFSFQQGGDSTYAAALGTLTVVVSVTLMLSTLLIAGRLPKGVLPWRD